MKKFTKSGEWVEPFGEYYRVGLSRENVEALGDITFVELPSIGALAGGESPSAVLEAVKAATDFHSPVSGRIIGVNTLLSQNPGLMNSSPEDEAWILEIVSEDVVLETLLDEETWRNWMAGL